MEALRSSSAKENYNNFIRDDISGNRGVTTIKNYQNNSNKIRIKTIQENPLENSKKRNSNALNSQNNDYMNNTSSNMKVKENNPGKTLYNIYENGSGNGMNGMNDTSSLYKGNFMGKAKNHPVFTQLQFHHSKNDSSELVIENTNKNDLRSKIDDARRSQNQKNTQNSQNNQNNQHNQHNQNNQNNQNHQNTQNTSQAKFKFVNENNINHQFKNPVSHSLSHIQKKYNFSTTTGKFNSIDRKENRFGGKGNTYGTFNNNLTHSFLKTDNYGFGFGGNNLVRQLPQLHKNNKKFYSNFNSERPDLAIKHVNSNNNGKSQSIKASSTMNIDPSGKKKMVNGRGFAGAGHRIQAVAMSSTNKFELYPLGSKKVY